MRQYNSRIAVGMLLGATLVFFGMGVFGVLHWAEASGTFGGSSFRKTVPLPSSSPVGVPSVSPSVSPSVRAVL